jgi:endonuclease YncB( thermonuclease family)
MQLIGSTLELKSPPEAAEPDWWASHVRDGDTLELGRTAIRLQGLAAPEWDEPLGTEARELMIKLVKGRTLRCEVDGERTHDRCVGICYLEGQDITEVLVCRGLARDCPRFSGGHYAVAERQAAAHGGRIGRAYTPPKYCR